MNKSRYPLLTTINSPADLRALAAEQLPPLAAELRDFLINNAAANGGHFAAGLGTVELTIALHYLLNTPHDRIVWDTGHQTYPHKVLTGRRDALPDIRKKGGISGFPKRSESEYDTFGVGHSSTSISAALGMAIAARRQGTKRRAVAVMGDGAMTAGLAFEAMNHAGHTEEDLLVILNDNEMSIGENVGGLNNYLTKLLSTRLYSGLRENSKKALSNRPGMSELARRSEEMMKGMMLPGTLFEELGFNYIGPLDGHDLPQLISTLTKVIEMPGPQFVHIVTRKGKGFAPAEKEPTVFHAAQGFDPVTGVFPPKTPKPPTYTNIFSDWLCDIAEQDDKVIGITPAMCDGSGLVAFSKRFPDRYFDVGIAEQHAVTLAAGMATDGAKAVVAIYSSFLQRGYDQLLHDVALQNLPVLFAVDRAGLVGADGATHHGAYDLSFVRCVPNMVIMAPSDENECRQMLYTSYKLNQPAMVRYPRGGGANVQVDAAFTELPIGKGLVKCQGDGDVALLGFGAMVPVADSIAGELNASVADMRFIKPIDEQLILDMAARHKLIVTLEDNAVQGGAGSAVNEVLQAHGVLVHVLNLGIPDRLIHHGSREETLADCGLDAEAVLSSIQQKLAKIS